MRSLDLDPGEQLILKGRLERKLADTRLSSCSKIEMIIGRISKNAIREKDIFFAYMNEILSRPFKRVYVWKYSDHPAGQKPFEKERCARFTVSCSNLPQNRILKVQKDSEKVHTTLLIRSGDWPDRERVSATRSLFFRIDVVTLCRYNSLCGLNGTKRNDEQTLQNMELTSPILRPSLAV
jgi:hypothetical protein